MAKQNLEAKKQLRQLNAVGDIEVSMANTEVQKADGARAMGAAQSGYCQVLAPFSGRIAKVYVKPYQTVTAGTPLFDLVSDGALESAPECAFEPAQNPQTRPAAASQHP